MGDAMTTGAADPTVEAHAVCPLCSGALRVKYATVADRLETSDQTYSVDECGSCGLGLVNPAPTGDLSRFYPERYLSGEEASNGGLVSRLERLYRFDQYRFDFQLLHRATGIDIGSTPSYLDVGAGSGERLAYARKRGCARCVGVDRYRFEKRSARGVELVNGEITDYVPAERFQVVSMFHVLEHVEDPVGVLAHIGREVVGEDGALIVQVPNYGCRERRWFGDRWFGLDAPRHLFHFDRRTIQDVVEAAGLTVSAVLEVNAPLHPVTIVPSLFPGLDVQRTWVRPGSAWSRLARHVLWAAATLLAVPFGLIQNLRHDASMLTVIARPSGAR